MTGTYYDIATEHAIMAEASDTGTLQSIPDAVLLGAVLVLLYDLLFAFTPSQKHPRSGSVVRFLSDIVYFLVCGMIGAVFLYRANEGILRWYLIVSGILGAYLYRRTLGIPVTALRRLLTSALHASAVFLWRRLLFPPLHVFRCGGRRVCSCIRIGIRRTVGHFPVRRRKQKNHGGRAASSAVPQEDVYEHGCISVSDRSL